MKFEWDVIKNETNFKKHQIWFEEAQSVWTDSNALEFYDDIHNEVEDRFIRLGISSSAKILVVIFCEREKEDIVRLISARKATDKERSIYEERI